jgi:predicted O-methyltransferase YrrM
MNIAPLDRLLEQLDLPSDLAYDPLWSAAPDFLSLIADHVLNAHPANIVECSSGTSSVILAACCRQLGHGKVLSLENGADHAERTRAELDRLGLSGLASVIDAPLRPTFVGAQEFNWYDLDGLDIERIDMLVVDGPPGFLQPLSRLPALPRLANRLVAGATVFLDDAARPDERIIATRWVEAFPGLQHRYFDLARGAAEFRWPE